jgi:hypothetical protein
MVPGKCVSVAYSDRAAIPVCKDCYEKLMAEENGVNEMEETNKNEDAGLTTSWNEHNHLEVHTFEGDHIWTFRPGKPSLDIISDEMWECICATYVMGLENGAKREKKYRKQSGGIEHEIAEIKANLRYIYNYTVPVDKRESRVRRHVIKPPTEEDIAEIMEYDDEM